MSAKPKGSTTPPSDKSAAAKPAAPAKEADKAAQPAPSVVVPQSGNTPGGPNTSTPMGASQPVTPGNPTLASPTASGPGSQVQSPTAQAQPHVTGDAAAAAANGDVTATGAHTAATGAEEVTPISEAAVKKLLDPLSRDQLYAILLKLGLEYETVLNEIKAVAQRDPSRTKLFVRELAWKTTSETLHKVFAQYGEIVEAAVVTDRVTKKSRGFGFVTFRDADAAARALEQPSKEIDGRVTQSNLASVGNPFKRQGAGGPPGFPRGGNAGAFGAEAPHHWQPSHRQDFKDVPAWQQHSEWQNHHVAMGRGSGITTPLSTAALHMTHGPPSPMNAYTPASPMYGRPPQHNGGAHSHQLQMAQQSSPIHAVSQAHMAQAHAAHHAHAGQAAVSGTTGAAPAAAQGQVVTGVAPQLAFGYTNTPPLSPSGQYGGAQYGFNYSTAHSS